jgi:transcriptional regulator with PAS, ATPase and Fis domain
MMKTTSIRTQFYVLVPMIFAGFTALAALLTYNLMRFSAGGGQAWVLMSTGGLLVLTVFLCALLILWLVFKPVEQFMRQAQQYVPDTSPPERRRGELEAITPIARTFHRVTEALSNMEARALFPDIIAPSPAMRSILGLIVKIAPTDSTVLILGESGTGKELVARNIHSHSKRAGKPFVAINCAGIPESLLESELFGHEKGSFTGAYTRKTGKLETANGGTVFLDEIADMPMVIQAKILRALQEREIERVGGNGPIPIDVRVIAATNKDLLNMVQQGTFREDLFFRIDVFSFRLPALRERSEDVPLLAKHLLRGIRPDTELSPRALAALTAHHWPGNVRELKNTIEAAAALAGEVIEPEHLNTSIRAQYEFLPKEIAVNGSVEEDSLDDRLAAMEKGMIIDALTRTGGVQVRAAEILGIKERSLWHRIAKHEIDVAAMRGESAHLVAGPQEMKA